MHVSYVNFIKDPMKFFNIDPITNCWLYKGTLKKGKGAGHGLISTCGGKVYIHVYMYTKKYGPVPQGMVLDHVVCDTPSCGNPDHVKPETRNGNMNRARKTDFCPKGHEYTLENTYSQRGRNTRECRTCRKERAQANYNQMKEVLRPRS